MNKYQKEIEALLQKKFRDTNKKLFDAYTKTLKEVKNKVEHYMFQYGNLSYSKKLEVSRLTSLMVQIENELDFLANTQEKHIYDYLNGSSHIAYNELFYDFEMSNGFGLEFNMLDNNLIETVINTPVAGIKLSERLSDGVIPTLKANLLSQLQVGLSQGISYQEMAQNLSEIAESSYKRAITIMRTEGGRVQAISRQKSMRHADDLGIEFEKEWSSALDMKTRDSHAALDGQRVKPDEYFKSPVTGHKALQPHMFGVAKEDVNCRCRTVSRIKGYEPKLKRDNETGEVIEYKKYDDWAKDKGKDNVVKSSGKSNTAGNTLIKKLNKTNMKKMVGKENFDRFAENLNSIDKSEVKDLFNELGDKLEFNKLKDGGAFARKNVVQVGQSHFDGIRGKKPLQTVYHEIGHALDSLGMEKLTGSESFATGNTYKRKVLGRMREYDEIVYHASALPKYKLKETINKDLWQYVNGDLPMIEDLGRRPRKKLEKAQWEEDRSRIYSQSKENFSKFSKELNELKQSFPDSISGLSDIIESTGYMGEAPIGWGHSKKYWKDAGKAEAEFFAHMTESVVNDDSMTIINKIFPNSVETWQQLVNDIVKGV